MQFTPVDFTQTGSWKQPTVEEVSGTFPESPAVMICHLDMDGSSISSLKITD